MRDMATKHKSRTIWLRLNKFVLPEEVSDLVAGRKEKGKQRTSQSRHIKTLMNGVSNAEEDQMDLAEELKRKYPCSKPSHNHCLPFVDCCLQLGPIRLTVWAGNIQAELHRPEANHVVTLDTPPNLPLFLPHLGIANLSTPDGLTKTLGRSTSLNSIILPASESAERETTLPRAILGSTPTPSTSISNSLRINTTGPCMNITTFATVYKLSADVIAVLRDLGFKGPKDIVHFTLDNFITLTKSKGGFDLRLGHAAELHTALTKWKEGLDLNGETLELF